MIFQSLISLYDRLDEARSVPPFGFSEEDIGFVITIDRDGRITGQPEDLRIKISATAYDYYPSVVPYSNKVNVRTSDAARVPNFMVDKADYIFGMSGSSKKDVHHLHFKDLVNEVCRDSSDEGAAAVMKFLEGWRPEDSVNLEGWNEISGLQGKWVAFRLHGDNRFIHERPEVRDLWVRYIANASYSENYSFVDGRKLPIQPQYAQFRFGAGASLVSFNEKAYESYGKKRGENAPISVEAEFKSATALKYLLRTRNQRLHIGDATTVFWTERKSVIETYMGQLLNPIDDGSEAVKVRKFLEAVRAGRKPSEIEKDSHIRFYILGLSVNKARLAVRFWHVATVGDMFDKLQQHFMDIHMEHSPGRRSEKEIEFPGVWHLLKETARETKDISPLLAGALMRAILTGGAYPQNLYQGIMGRIRADRDINYLKASVLKAVLRRNFSKEVPMSLDPKKKETAYLLGRLFAVLEKAQLDALGKVNATIKDRFFGAASATPATVFPRLLKLSQHHIEKAEYGHLSDRRIAEIMEDITEFPSHLSLEEQGMFAIAYYQQKNALWRKKESDDIKGEDQ
ncbi:MAG: type I-C CRISPR-associated protein Cas8c/Csd1 [Deltaproteobacteria bacterium]|nr:type I-C CRISPR-associated protein Cas8c/Csd1 [Deltaproteobacteria bacterium]